VPEVLRCFCSPQGLPEDRDPAGFRGGLPHSDIDGSPGARPLPVASRSRATSFVGSTTPGHPPSAVSRFPRQRALALAISRTLALARVHLVRCPPGDG